VLIIDCIKAIIQHYTLNYCERVKTHPKVKNVDIGPVMIGLFKAMFV
jgi:hypothetical protein